jgi:AAA+ ATPase superfamily predicted ATPase
MEVIGRKEELKELSAIFNSKRADFVVVYGRRRIGKTFLIEKFFNSKKCRYFHVTGIQNGLLKEQLAEFSKAIGKTFYSGAKIETTKSWMQAFEELNNAITNANESEKIIVFIDELPWMATKRSRILQAIDYYWNHYWSKDGRIKLIICGSSASWIIKNIIYNKGGLHNRYTHNLLIKAFSLHDTKEFLLSRNIKLTDKQILQLYMVVGGVPHYLDKIKCGLSAAQNIDQLCFNENGFLFSEFEKLFKSLFEDSKIYVELIRIISKLREGVTRSYIEKHSKLSKKGGTLTDRLNDLEQAGFIKSFLPFKHQRQGIYYRVIDEYVYFYLKWIEPEKKYFLSRHSGSDYWTSVSNTSIHYIWMGYSFESVCYKHIDQIQQALKIPNNAKAGVWRFIPKVDSEEVGTQIDLLFERSDGVVNVCEIKCTDKPFIIDKKYYEILMRKVNIYQKISKSQKQIFVAFVTTNGIKTNAYSNCASGIVTLSDLFN